MDWPANVNEQDLVVRTGQILSSKNGDFGIGAVLFSRVRETSKVVVVQKSKKDGYEFGGYWAVPGGMTRVTNDEESVEVCVRNSLVARVEAETGLVFAPNKIDHRLLFRQPLVSSYHVEGERKYTVVLPFFTSVDACTELTPNDASIDAAKWTDWPLEWELFAPVNRVILARVFWPTMSVFERRNACGTVATAIDQICCWSELIGLPRISTNWLT